ncbi:MBL fold metallo-hydrolase [Halobacteriales archaeon Cl-PHB]
MFRRIPVPTPFQVGPVNAYVADRTLVDPGPDSEEAWSALLEGLGEASLAPDDIDRVLVTHPHPDHFGLAGRIQDLGAEVVASPMAAHIMDDFASWLDYQQEFFTPFLERCGLSAETADTVTELPEAFLNYAASVTVDRTIDAGDTVTVDGTDLAVESVQGHAEGELLFAYEHGGERIGLVGDNVLPGITPNPFLQPPHEPGEERPRVLPAFNRSLERLAEEPFDRFLPGHRDVIEDPQGRIAEIRAAHEDRTDDVRALVDGPTTALDVMEALFGDLPVTEQFSGISEAVGHLDVLEERDEVERDERGGVFVYEPRQ